MLSEDAKGTRSGADDRPRRADVPRATYRVQLNAGFTFRDAQRIVPYLADLGIGALYTSPFFAARPGSTHGYDVTDYGTLNPEIGTPDDFQALTTELRRHGLGLVVDFVPNHMGIGQGANPWWQDVLENGQGSTHAAAFDIDWRPLKRELQGKVLLPILGDHYGVVLERGELVLRMDEGAFRVAYWETDLPVAPPTYPMILRDALPDLEARLDPEDPDLLEYRSIVTAFERLPPQSETDPDLVAERRREQTVGKRRLATLVGAVPEVAEAVEGAVAALNGAPGDPRSFDALDALLGAQSWRLSSFLTAGEEINYRRFFAINELAAIRQEVPEVFAATHAALLGMVADGSVTGIRIDHPDGLWDPAGYLRQVQQSAAEALGAAWDGQDRDHLPIYLLVEKILEPGEDLPDDWACHGTVGYDFARLTTGLFVDPANRRPFDDLYARFTGWQTPFADLVYHEKRGMLRTAFASETNVLAQALNRISEQNRRTRDFTLNSLRDALREVIACFPVYRTYVVCDGAEGAAMGERDRSYVGAAVAAGRRRNPATDPGLFAFLHDILTLRFDPEATAAERAERCRFAMKVQQLTGPVMAKGLEDTAFYRYNRLVSLNEVGGDPAAFGILPADVHKANLARLRRWPHAMLASSTHDTKRSEDVRARIDALSEMPREWRAAANRWARLNRRCKAKVEGHAAPSRNDEVLLYQTLLGTWPFGVDDPGPDYADRIDAYLQKAAREAGVETNWINPNADYEAALSGFARAILDRGRSAAFLDDLAGLRETVARAGAFTALSQQVLKLTAPGVPDVYQGTEVWDFSLVDPDNRRPVDYAARTKALNGLRRRKPGSRLADELVASLADGRIKLWVTMRALGLRRERPDLFAHGDYLRLDPTGPHADHLFAFARRDQAAEAITVVPRLVAGLLRRGAAAPVGAAVWGETLLPVPGAPVDAHYRDRFTGATVTTIAADRGAALRVADVLARFPVALLEREGDGDGG